MFERKHANPIPSEWLDHGSTFQGRLSVSSKLTFREYSSNLAEGPNSHIITCNSTSYQFRHTLAIWARSTGKSDVDLSQLPF